MMVGPCRGLWKSATLVVGAKHFDFPQVVQRMLCGHFSHSRRMFFEGRCAQAVIPFMVILLKSHWRVVFLKLVMQNEANSTCTRS